MDFAGHHMYHRLVFAPLYCVRRQAEWAEHDKQVCLLLGAPSDLAGRYQMCFPGKKYDIGPPCRRVTGATRWCAGLTPRAGSTSAARTPT